MRLDHLTAAVNYALEQAVSSDIQVLDFGDNENALSGQEQVEELRSMCNELKKLKDSIGNCEVVVVNSERFDDMAEVYYKA